MAAYIAEMGMMITDMIIVGRLGSNELAAVGLTADLVPDGVELLTDTELSVVSVVAPAAAEEEPTDEEEGEEGEAAGEGDESATEASGDESSDE